MKTIPNTPHCRPEKRSAIAIFYCSYGSSKKKKKKKKNIGYDLTKHIQVPESTCNNITNYANKFSFPLLSVCDTMKLMKTVPNTHTLDPLDIDGYLLRISLPAIAPSLTYIYNLSLQTGDVHPDWKLARITPIYKGDGSRKDPSSYRPISVTSHLIKPLERHVKNALMTHLLNCDLFSERQAAFIKGHSTTTVLHAMTDDWLRAIVSGFLHAGHEKRFRYLES